MLLTENVEVTINSMNLKWYESKAMEILANGFIELLKKQGE